MPVAATGFTLWLTGLSGAGKTTLATRIADELLRAGAKVELLDGDLIRTGLSRDLGYTREDRDTHVSRLGFVSELLSRNRVIAIVAAISPYRQAREEVRRRIANFIEVFVECPISVLVERDPKGLYRRAMAGEIDRFTGISDPYEEPLNPEVVVHSGCESVKESFERIWREIIRRDLLDGL